MRTETVTIPIFKATCLGLLKQVKMNGEPILVTLNGESVAMVVPPPPRETSSVWMEEFRNSGKIVGGIIAPAAEE